MRYTENEGQSVVTGGAEDSNDAGHGGEILEMAVAYAVSYIDRI